MTKTIAIRSEELHSKLKKLKDEWKLKRYEDVISKLVFDTGIFSVENHE